MFINKMIPDSNTFLEDLYKIDMAYAQNCKDNTPCRHCGGQLDFSNYFRKPRGHNDIGHIFNIRFSLCCREDGCRKRFLPPSCRYLKGFVYHMSIVLLVGYFLRPSYARLKRIEKITKIDIRTLKRWEYFWRTQFKRTKLYKIIKERLFQTDLFPRDIFHNFADINKILFLFRKSTHLF